jgi:superfamily II DNA or RNA helicase
MDEHFGLPFSIMGENFDGKLAASWRTQQLVIAPLDRLKREEYRELLQQVGGFDLVVCDEAHRLTAQRRFLSQKLEKTANYRLFEFLVHSRLIRHVENNDKTPRSPRLLLLSATPHQGDDERFVHLLNLARPDLFKTDRKCVEQLTTSALVETLTRTPKSRAVDWEGRPLFKGHQTVTLDVHWTVEETEISRLLTEYILKSLDFVRDSDRGTQLVVQLVMHTFHKIAASSWAALDRALQRRLDALDGRVSKLSELLGDGDEDEDGDGPPKDVVLPAKAFFENERQLLETLLARLRGLAVDSKWKRCAELMANLDTAEAGVKVLVFTQYRVTQELLRERLGNLFPGATIEVIHGEVEMRARQQARLRFERQSRFLLSTEAGGEGVNLQRACHVMLNYDLPWNPMRLQQRIGRLDRFGQKRVVQVFNLRVPDSWDQHISARILERLDVIQRTMALASPDQLEDYREMILGQVAEQVDVSRLFAESQAGRNVSEAEVDEWVRGAVQSVERWRGLFGSELGLSDDTSRLRPLLTSEHFKAAYRFACEHQGIRFRETRNSANQFVPEVFNFDLPAAFRDPVFRPSRTVHVVFDRDVYAVVRGQDLGTVRGQPIRPLLTGFGEPFTDWLFQTSMYARAAESAFSIKAGNGWTHGSGWLFVFALRWSGKRRRLWTPDSLALVFTPENGPCIGIPSPEAVDLVTQASNSASPGAGPGAEMIAEARAFAQRLLRDYASKRDVSARSSAGLSLLSVAAVMATS